jgi:spermidine synthase
VSETKNPEASVKQKRDIAVLVISVFIAGLCSIIYELLISTISSYFLGDSIRQFSLTIGVYLAAMGIGSYLSRLVNDKRLLKVFINAEILLGLLGGLSVPILYFSFVFTDLYGVVQYTLVFSIGILIGLEIPFLSRLMERYYQLKVNISNVLSLDYIGALVATLLFPFILLPNLGTFRSSIVFGIINMAIGFLNLWRFGDKLESKNKKRLSLSTAFVFTGLVVLLVFSQTLMDNWSQGIYQDRVIYQSQSPYQYIVFTKEQDDLRLFLDGNLQFSSADEYRYHESLVNLPLAVSRPQDLSQVLVLGGGDGLIVRELLKIEEIQKITLIDLDPQITELSISFDSLRELNGSSMLDPRVEIINEDAMVFLEGKSDFKPEIYGMIISDLPDPNNVSLARLYSREMYQLVAAYLSVDGVFVTQATSVAYAPGAYWTIGRSIQAAGFVSVIPYHLYVPSFGDWGFFMGTKNQLGIVEQGFTKPQGFGALAYDSQVFSAENLERYFVFEEDLRVPDLAYSSLDRPLVHEKYLEGWKKWR